MLESSFFDAFDQYRPNSSVSEWPQGEIHGHDPAAGESEQGWGTEPRGESPPPWCHIRLTFGDGAHVDMLAVVADGRGCIDDGRAQPPLTPGEFAVLGEGAGGPAGDDCRVVDGQQAGTRADVEPRGACEAAAAQPVGRRARPARPRGVEGRRVVAEIYRGAQQEGRDPVLAVMCATGHSRRKSLRLIAAARDAGFLAPRHNRR
ncbi:DUF6214 family protein [Streptomyces sp. NPDC052225]|uniref:DUF6214 family protein n=1 Tax=Streptomyces sp. NPDC052225 TaxID=3154949 RepID=UPI00342D7DED